MLSSNPVFVSPYGTRCNSIHDPRVSGTSPSWLPHTETQGNTTGTDINVESMHQKRANEIHSDNPFGHQFSLKYDTFGEIYKLIANLNYARGGWIDTHRRHAQPIDPIIKIQIALMMRGTSEWCYKFLPHKVIHNELCMVLQHRAFRVERDRIFEIPLHECQPRLREDHIDVREIAFGPDSDTSVRGVALWFNIHEDDVSACTEAQSKRYRWKPIVGKKERKGNSTLSFFDHLDYFEMIRPRDAMAFDLATDILLHRLAVLKTERIAGMRERFEEQKVLELEKKGLMQRFEALRRHWILWAWPVNAGREKVDRNTAVPKVDGMYQFPHILDNFLDFEFEEEDECLGLDSRNVWQSFVYNKFEEVVRTGMPCLFCFN